MCRLFCFRSDVAAKVHHSLVVAPNSLRFQSNEHQDGWGIAYWANERACVAKGLSPAHSDPEFERVSGQFQSPTVLAHVRRASVGAVHLRNAHPFLHGGYAFAHNGTLREFSKHQPEVEALIDLDLRDEVKGETDSERCFYVFLSRLRSLVSGQIPNVTQVAAALAHTMRALSAIADVAGEEPSSMNFAVTNGLWMVATRRRRSLFFSEWKKKADSPHAHPVFGSRVAQLVIASEKVSAEDHWYEVPEDGIVGVDERLVFRQWKTSDL
ncbi:MAG: class II glutamine amidotransferase [Myxococcota bacterium]